MIKSEHERKRKMKRKWLHYQVKEKIRIKNKKLKKL